MNGPETEGADTSGTPARTPPDERVQIPGYRILRTLGEGGMGTVYLARQQHPIERNVAVKVVKLGMDTKVVVARFEAERQALAIMDHPNIARVHEAGATVSGRPYFVMEYVEGTPITTFCDEQRLDTRTRLQLLVSVCQAIHHAHQKGVIHRDVKPSNVLISVHDGKPVPKVIDFGIAKATHGRLTDQTVYTAHGHVIGTPEYMSPEQADPGGRDIDATSDVYALGVLAYELSTGTLPLDPARMRTGSLSDIQRHIREDEPPPPSTRVARLGATGPEIAARRSSTPAGLRRAVRKDLDWVIMRALEKDRSRRYQSAWNLAADIERYLADEAVDAGPPSTTYRLSKLVRRHRRAVASLVSVLVILLAATVVSSTMFVRAERAKARAEREARKASAVTAFLQEMLASANPRNEGRDVTVREVLEEASATVGEGFADEPEVRADVLATLGVTYRALGMWSRAEQHLEAAVEARRTSVGPDHPDHLAALDEWATATAAAGNYARAESLSTVAFETRRRTLGPWHPDVARALATVGGYVSLQGDGPRAAGLLEEALGLLAEDGSGPWRVRGALLEQLGLVYSEGVDRDKARACLEEAVGLYEDAGERSDPVYCRLLMNLGWIHWQAGELEETEALFRSVLARERLTRSDDDPTLARHVRNLGLVVSQRKRFSEADSLLLDALERYRRILGPRHTSVATTLQHLAEVAIGRTDFVRAESLMHSALEIRRDALGDEHAMTAVSHYTLGRIARGRRELELAESRLREAVAIYERMAPEGHAFTAEILHALGDVLLDAGRLGGAERAHAEALAMRRALFAPGSPEIGASMVALAECFARQGRWDAADSLATRGATFAGTETRDRARDVLAMSEALRGD